MGKARYHLNKNETTITGRAIASTVMTLSNLGPLGKDVLIRLGVPDIELDQRYPFQIRTDMFEEIYRRFGSISLLACGYDVRGFFPRVEEAMNVFFENNKSDLTAGGNQDRLDRGLELLIQFCADMNSMALREATNSKNGIHYGASAERITAHRYQFTAIQASKLRYEAYTRGTIISTIQDKVAKYWDLTMVLNEEKSREGDDWAEYVWDIEASPLKSPKSSTEITTEKRLEIRNKLVNEVLSYADDLKNQAEDQKNKLESLSDQLGRYVPPQIHQAMFSGDYNAEITTRRKKLTIFFSDIKNFTSTSEGLQPEDLTNYLNEYFSEMTKIALNYGATIDKYIGDAMMVFFGDPESEGEREDARACVEMALSMQTRMRELREKWSNEGFSNPFEIRIGINTGYCNVGNFGSNQRLTYTIIGGEVNVAQRLEASADVNGILMSYETYAHAKDMVEVEERETLKMKGITREIKVFAVIKKQGDEKKKTSKDKGILKKQELSEINQMKIDIKTVKKQIKELNQKIDLIFRNHK